MGTNPNQSQHINILKYSIPCILTLLNTFLITPIKCAMFIYYIRLLYFCYMFRCHIHHRQGELMCPLLKTLCPYIATNYSVYSFYSQCNLKICLTASQRWRTEAAEMKLLRPLAGYTLYDHKTNDYIRHELQITSILDKIDEYRRNWFQHLQRMPENRIPSKSYYYYRPQGRRTTGRPKKRWREQL